MTDPTPTAETLDDGPQVSRAQSDRSVPGPSPLPTSNLLLADIAMRAGSYLLRDVIERKMLKKRYGSQEARAMVQNRGIAHKAASLAAGKVAAKSPVGAALVGGVILTKIIFDRGGRRNQRKREADRKLLERAQDE
ncbi:hypothetical protein [Pontixanthobacter sp.]|uniref:hypothetical protein n=1 Tax=Pontixanthobacter sp. TaxID=2792078 RepID=UPI003C7BA07D